jgi:hypothetical protein
VIDLLLRQAEASRAGAQGDHDYDVIGHDGMVIGRIFARSERRPTATRRRGTALCRHSLGGGQRDVTAPALRQGLA